MEERSFDELVDATCPSCRHAVSLDASAPAVPAKAPSAPSVRKTGKSKKNLYIVGGIIVVAIIVIVVVALSL